MKTYTKEEYLKTWTEDNFNEITCPIRRKAVPNDILWWEDVMECYCLEWVGLEEKAYVDCKHCNGNGNAPIPWSELR